MNMNNIWAGLLGLILGIAFVIGFYDIFGFFITSLDPEVRPLLAVPLGVIIFLVGFIIPISLITEDDRGQQA